MCVYVGDVMDKCNVVIAKDYILVQKNNCELQKHSLLLFRMVIAYILQRVSEDEPYRTDLQDSLQDYLFEIYNNDSYESVSVPNLIKDLIEYIENEIQSSKFLKINFDNREIFINESELIEIFQEIIDGSVSNCLDDINSVQINLQIDQSYGLSFSNYIVEYFSNFGNIVELQPEKKTCAECQIFYGDELLFGAIEETQVIREIEIIEGLEEGILLNFKYLSDNKDEYKYMYFPFWNTGDKVELSIIFNNDCWFLKGKHSKSKIISMLKI